MAVSVVPLLGTFVVAVVFYSVTAHLAARFVLGDVPLKRAFVVGLVPAIISFALQAYQNPAIIIVLALAADFFTIRAVYRLRYRTAGMVAVVHYTVSVILGLTIFNLVRLLGTAPT
ncbi:DUF7473 family protein [Halorussus amylolyticus]|uniref:DUF7473 family protein n=1 Tax=Halorussus amylolyticus TaxID=1126242 RepID=UPI00104F3084|nr:hypothetical protein [Halorussus amylolyticus]